MRLIEASTLKLVSKHDAEVPPYAILSHTWGNDEDEVSFKEMQAFAVESRKTTVFAHPFARKTGFAKIQQSARLALSQGLHYIWIDTCCIDKSSSAELSEAINSMFRWYQGSTVCYAFLSDVRVPLSEASGVKVWKDSMIPYLLDSLQDMQRSRWFTRGWTLQELVAPRTVEFYSQDWSLIGDKNNHSGLRKLISSITGIDEAVLDGSRSLQSLGVAERMHWASRRVTTRLEDQAYCLMGMFDINMPLLYGEGSKAFIRLQEEILKTSIDHSLFAWEAVDEYYDPDFDLKGLLAPSPKCFRNTGHIVPLPLASLNASEPSSMTNMGLQITLDLEPVDWAKDVVVAYLDCISDLPNLGPCNVALRLMALGNNQYVRVNSSDVLTSRAYVSPTRDSSDRRKRIYVKQHFVPPMPDVLLQGIEIVHAHQGRLLAVWPHGSWHAAQQQIRSRGVPRDGILAAFRFEFDTQERLESERTSELWKRSDPVLLDIFVGTSLETKFGHSQKFGKYTYTTSSAWCSSFISDKLLPLPVVVSAALTHITGPYRRTSCRYDTESRPPIMFHVKREVEKSQVKVILGITTTHEISSSHTTSWTPDLMGSKVAEYESMGQRLTIEDSANLTLLGQYSSYDKIRVTRHDFIAPIHNELINIRRSLRTAPTNIVVRNADQTNLNDFETYFSQLLIQACMARDIPGATELLVSRLSTALVDVWISGVKTQAKGIDEAKLLEGFRPLHCAALLGGRGEVAEILLDNGANPFLETSLGLNSIHVAIAMGHTEVLERIFAAKTTSKYAIYKMSTCDTLANFAASYIHHEKVTTILDHLSKLLASGNHAKFSLLANNLATLDFYHDRVMSHAVIGRFHRNALRESVLHRAAAMNNIHAARWALTKESSLLSLRDSSGRTPLFHAAAAGSIEICQMLLEKGAKIEEADQHGRTPLCVASRHGHLTIVEMFLKSSHTSSVREMATNCGSRLSAWHYAALSGDWRILHLLDTHLPVLAKSVYSQGDATMTPLHIASSLGLLDCVNHLVDASGSSNINAKTKYAFVPGTTRDADLLVETGEAKTAEEWARARGYIEIATVLRDLREGHSDGY